MFCTYCGSSVQADQRFCGSCGNATPPIFPAPATDWRLARHVKLLGMLWIAFSAIHLLRGGERMAGAHFVRLIGHTWYDDVPWGWPAGDFLHSILAFAGALAVIMATAGFLAGFGLLEHRPWARGLAIALAVIALLHPPLGTALGIYTLWVLVPANAEQEWHQIAR